MLKTIKIPTIAPTRFGSRRNHHQGAISCLAKTTIIIPFCSSLMTWSILWRHSNLLCKHHFSFFTKYNQLMSTIVPCNLSPEKNFDHNNFWSMMSQFVLKIYRNLGKNILLSSLDSNYSKKVACCRSIKRQNSASFSVLENIIYQLWTQQFKAVNVHTIDNLK
jgi:hypothetical protein